jgi:hypothetical protein
VIRIFLIPMSEMGLGYVTVYTDFYAAVKC